MATNTNKQGGLNRQTHPIPREERSWLRIIIRAATLQARMNPFR